MRAINRKLFRDLWEIKGQALAISLVIAAGLAMFTMYQSVFHSLRYTQETYYDRYRFGDVFAQAKRVPLWRADEIARIPGVSWVEPRVVASVTLDMEGLDEPLAGQLISIPEEKVPILNDVALQRGRYIEPGHPDEVLVAEGFALAHELEPGDTIAAIINGRRRELEIVGLALSPEFVYVVRPGELIPDDSRYGIFWMGREALSSAFDMKGGFNDVVLRLMPGASVDEVIDRLDRILEPYGGLGAIPRAQQFSHWSLDAELTGLQTMGFIMPMIFLSVAAFLLNVVLSRIVSVQRSQIAALKALGYSRFEIGLHYVQWSLVIAAFGALFGIAGGSWMGSGMVRMYNDYFRFPFLDYQISLRLTAVAIAISAVAAVLGAWSAVRRAASLPPAEAMRPEPPASYNESFVERLGFRRFFSQPARMILRNIERQPGRTLSSIIGIAFAAAMLVVGLFFIDAMDRLIEIQFEVINRQDVTVTFVEPRSAAAHYELARMPGVMYVENTRSVPARLVNGHRSRQTAITGMVNGGQLNRVVDASLRQVDLPPAGLVLSTKLAEILDAERGDELIIEVLEGTRPTRRAVVVDLVEEYMGMAAYMDADALHDLMREARLLSGAFMRVDSRHADELYRRLKHTPAVAGVAIQQAMVDKFREMMDQTMGLMVGFSVFFACIIAFGVVYNAARVSLSERSRELASLRVLGFTRAEISFILLGELAVLTLIAIPLGLWMGYGLAALTTWLYDTEFYRFPLVVSTRTQAFSAAVVLLAAVVSGLIVRRHLDRLDLVEVLKTRE